MCVYLGLSVYCDVGTKFCIYNVDKMSFKRVNNQGGVHEDKGSETGGGKHDPIATASAAAIGECFSVRTILI